MSRGDLSRPEFIKSFSPYPIPLLGETVLQHKKTDLWERGRGGRVGGLPGSGLSKDKRDASQRFRAVTFSRSDSAVPSV
jgi:hypothetical protein